MTPARKTPIIVVGPVLLLIGCAGDTPATDARVMPAAMPSSTTPAQMAAGSDGFGNATMPAPAAGSGGAATARMPRSSCMGGRYVGRYDCDLEVIGIPSTLAGDVSFVLEINQTASPASGCQEFCPDLVIAKGSGTLFGLAGDTGWAFEGKLEGGLDCKTGEFRATAPNGIYGLAGSTTAGDPSGVPTVLDPALGEFNGTLDGTHASGPPERIAGEWKLLDAAELASCTGPFMVDRQP